MGGVSTAGPPTCGEAGGTAVGPIVGVSQTSDCDRRGLLKRWVVGGQQPDVTLRFPSCAASLRERGLIATVEGQTPPSDPICSVRPLNTPNLNSHLLSLSSALLFRNLKQCRLQSAGKAAETQT